MKNIQDIEVVLTRMAELLRLGSRSDWAMALENQCSEIASNPVAGKVNILSMYGGMGSLNDLILYKNGQPLFMENNELDMLRSKLYELCHQ